ncbi:Crp/Fnr family transcriptional regulator [Algoriphagus halophytocola]|uniref:Crp/Fnr family transcriptional regulator n=1 Tax=Algoriphagus halophytocola TaxID=2991499 RepID=A0ABY6MKU5_9BACT|nr:MULTISPECIES: Crp/Fnr family transcriptional regulator [unclassified Algoriphagus]UZD22901.1 Crp/Fnr family transcriptional regulator [Algoriphagus sp. TR-M5]WBL44169.1 Crp/Fnr family transcriptional regulator [Algoriphagus sp. TR-M9]
MNDSFFEEIYNHPSISEGHLNTIRSAHRKVAFKKHDHVLLEGSTSHAYYLIEEGMFRSYLIDYQGNEITTDFFVSNDILIEVASLFLRIPSKENIQALSDGIVWEIDFEAFQNLYRSIPGFTEWGRTWMTNQLFEAKNRAVKMHTLSASQRYLELMSAKPEVIKRAPLKHIATYLGITDTSLSRIRKEMLLQR